MPKPKIRRRPNPVARALRRIRPKVVPSAKAYQRRAKHKSRPDDYIRGGSMLFCVMISRISNYGDSLLNSISRRRPPRFSVSLVDPQAPGEHSVFLAFAA